MSRGLGGNLVRYAHEEIPALTVAPTLLLAVLRLRLPYLERRWGTDYRGPLYLHAAAGFRRSTHVAACDQIRRALPRLSPGAALPTPELAHRVEGYLLCRVRLIGCDWHARERVFQWHIRAAERVPKVPALGHQILWPLSRGVSPEGLARLGEVRS